MYASLSTNTHVHERCRDFYEKQRAGTAPADSSLGGGEMDRRDTCLKVDELYKCRTMFGRNVTCITGLTDQGNQKKKRSGVPATSSESSVALCAVNKVHGWPCLHSHLLTHIATSKQNASNFWDKSPPHLHGRIF